MKNTGFTLIELLVVVLIIGILSAVALPQYQRAVDKSRYVQVMTMSNSLSNAAEVYRLANGEFPMTFEDMDIEFKGELSTDKTTLKLNGYVCRWYVKSASGSKDSIFCRRTEGNRDYGYRIMFEPSGLKKVYCVAATADDQSNQLCKSLGATYSFDNGQGLLHYIF